MTWSIQYVAAIILKKQAFFTNSRNPLKTSKKKKVRYNVNRLQYWEIGYGYHCE